ncbi:MAG: heme biosynthesis protein HemY [Betaproteobacteria bacterium]|nr:heme biosynthesis protein HemY [Betaproteobacteria bacterium]
MRVVIWLLVLFAVAAGAALFASTNPGTVTVFWPPYRVDVSLNLVLLALVVAFVVAHFVLGTVSTLGGLPEQARRWRALQRERAVQGHLVDALFSLAGGRYVRASESLLAADKLQRALMEAGQDDPARQAETVFAAIHMLGAEAQHALQKQAAREEHLQTALQTLRRRRATDALDGLLLRATRWALDDNDAAGARAWWQQLSQGAMRRAASLRLRFRTARLAGENLEALVTVRQLIKHKAFRGATGENISQALAVELLRAPRDAQQLEQAWARLEPQEKEAPSVALLGAQRLLDLGGDGARSRAWLLPLWNAFLQNGSPLNADQQVRLVQILEAGFGQADAAPDSVWLARIENAQMANPRNPLLQYLAGAMCLRMSLWGKAEHFFKQASAGLQSVPLQREALSQLQRIQEQRARR